MRKTKPTMTAEAFRKMIDYTEGDIVQILHGKYAGRLAMIISIGSYVPAEEEAKLIYNLKLSDKEGIRAPAKLFTLIRHADDGTI